MLWVDPSEKLRLLCRLVVGLSEEEDNVEDRTRRLLLPEDRRSMVEHGFAIGIVLMASLFRSLCRVVKGLHKNRWSKNEHRHTEAIAEQDSIVANQWMMRVKKKCAQAIPARKRIRLIRANCTVLGFENRIFFQNAFHL